jgi:hypothetical protein
MQVVKDPHCVLQLDACFTLRNTKLIPAIEQYEHLMEKRILSISRQKWVRSSRRPPHVIFALQPIAAVNRNNFLPAILPLILNATEIRVSAIVHLVLPFCFHPPFLEHLSPCLLFVYKNTIIC